MNRPKSVSAIVLLTVALGLLMATQAMATSPTAESSAPQIFYPPGSTKTLAQQSVQAERVAQAGVATNLFWEGGYIQKHPDVHLIFWGSEWNSHPGTREKLIGLYQSFPGSAYGGILTQYFDHTGYYSGPGGLSWYTDTRSSHPTKVGFGDVAVEVNYSMEHQAGWNPHDYEDQYVVFAAPGSTYNFEGGNNSFCAFHTWNGGSWQSSNTFLPWPSSECLRGLEPWGSMQVSASHEWGESVTDPIPVEGYIAWMTGIQGGEIADLCNTLGPSERAEIAPGMFAAKLYDDYQSALGNGGCASNDPNPQRFEVATGSNLVSGEPHKAILFGTVAPAGWNAHYQFQVTGPSGTMTFPATYGSVSPPFSKDGVGTFAEGLSANTTYHYQLYAFNDMMSFGGVGGENFSQKLAGASGEFTTPTWPPLVEAKSPTGITVSQATINGTVNPQSTSTTYQVEWGLTANYGAAQPIPGAAVGGGLSPVAVSQTLTGLQPESTYHYRISATSAEGTTHGPDRTLFTAAFSPNFVNAFGSEGVANGQFKQPSGIVVGGSGNLFVSDQGNNRVEKFGPAGEYQSKFGALGAGQGQFNAPRGIALDPGGHVFVADTGNSRVEELSATGKFIAQFGPGEGTSPLSTPYDVVADKAGHLFVSDPSRAAVYEYSVEGKGPEGNHLLAVAPYATGEKTGFLPVGLGYERTSGNIWGVDEGNTKVDEFQTSCGGCAEHPTFIPVFGAKGSGLGQLSTPYDIAVRPSGGLIVLDRGNNRVEQFSPAGELIGHFAETGPEHLSQPSSIAYGKGYIYVADTGNNRIERWSEAGEPEATTGAVTEIVGEGGKATLNATVVPVGAPTSYHFEYGMEIGEGQIEWVSTPAVAVGSGFTSEAVSTKVTGLHRGWEYHCRAVATSAFGTFYGDNVEFLIPMEEVEAEKIP